MDFHVLNHQDMLLDDQKNVFSSPGAWDGGFPEIVIFHNRTSFTKESIAKSRFLNNVGKPLSQSLMD